MNIKKILASRKLTSADIIIPGMVIILAVVGYFLYNQFANYTYLSDQNNYDILRAKLWTIGWLLISTIIIYWKRNSSHAPAFTVLAISVYFVILYGILFQGTEYGLNGHWGDNGNRLALICKMMAFKSMFYDWYLKDLPSFYPPLWFVIMAIYGKLLNIEAYQTIKFGYLLVFLVYPWLLFFSWKKLVSPLTSAAITFATIFIGYKYLLWVHYQHITASLFLPWWLYYFERATEKKEMLDMNWRFYLKGAIYGGILFMTYYYWFFIAFSALPFVLLLKYIETKSFKLIWDNLKSKAILMFGVAIVSMVYWLPLLKSIFKYGMESAQNAFFEVRHANLIREGNNISLESILVFVGIFFLFYLWNYWPRSKLLYFFLGGLILILGDRIFNMAGSSLQARKVLEYVLVFTMAPLAIGLVAIWGKVSSNKNLRLGIFGVLFLITIIVANAHTEIYKDRKYKIGIDQRVPKSRIEVFGEVNINETVFLTTRYIEASYLPYYMFIPYNNMSAHTASRYSEREQFLDEAARIKEPEILAYVLANNRYDPIDYIYLPLNKETGLYELKLYQTVFNKKPAVKTIPFACDYTKAPDFFILKHKLGLYEISSPERSEVMDRRVQENYQRIILHLKKSD